MHKCLLLITGCVVSLATPYETGDTVGREAKVLATKPVHKIWSHAPSEVLIAVQLMILVLCGETECNWKFGKIAVSSSPGSNCLIGVFLDQLIVRLKAIRSSETSGNIYPKHKVFS
jgi:hypothetical protein